MDSLVQSTKPGSFWKKQIDLAIATRETYEAWWDANLKAYSPYLQGTPEQYGGEVHTNRTFIAVERRKADLFYQRPDVTLQPSPALDVALPGPVDPTTGQPTQIPASLPLSAHQEIVNEKLGEDGIDATELMDAVLFDIECTQGFGATELGYESVTVMQEMQDPITGEIVSVPVPIHEHCFWEHFSGKQFLCPHNWRSTNWDRAPWLGRRFELPLTESNRQKYKLPADFTGAKPSDKKQHYDHGAEQSTAEDVFTGTVVWYRSALYRQDRPHPDHFTLLVMVDGIEEPVIEMDSPHQTLDDKGGLTPDSLIGNPIHPFSVRKVTDTAYVASSGTMIRALENEHDIYRTQSVQFRDANTLKWMYNTDVLPKDSVDKIVRAPIGGMIGVPGDVFATESIRELPQGSIPRETNAGAEAIDNDISRTTGVDASGAGVQSTNTQTATAEQIQSANANARLDKDRGVILKRYIKGVTKYSTLIARYFPVEQAAQIVGAEKAQIWDQWRKSVPASLAWTALPDSALRVDQAVDRKQALDFYSFVANDPFFAKGRAKLAEKLCRKFHMDPTELVQAPDPPKPEPPKLSFSFKGEDLVGPQAPIVLEIAQQLGITVSAESVTLSQQMLLQAEQLAAAEAAEQEAQKGDTKHKGKQAPAESLSKHHSDQTGAMQGIGGAPSPMGAGGVM